MLQALAPHWSSDETLPPREPEYAPFTIEIVDALTAFGSAIGADDQMIEYYWPHGPFAGGQFIGPACRRAGFTYGDIIFDLPGRVRWIENPNRTSAALLGLSVSTAQGLMVSVGFLIANAALPRRRQAEMMAVALMPAIERAFVAATRLRMVELQVAGCKAALDRCDMGVILLSAGEHIIFENRNARRLLDVGLGVRRAGRSIAANAIGESVQLRVAMEHVMQNGAGGCSRMPILALARGRGQHPLLASVVAPHDAPACTASTAAILYLFDPDRNVTHLLDSTGRLYGLSPMESRLAAQLVCGASIKEAASTLRVKEMTARGYLKQVFAKTGVNRQAALVRLMMSSMIRLSADIETEVMLPLN